MPIYEYRCPKCGKRYELLRGYDEMNEPFSCETEHCGGIPVLVLSNVSVQTRNYLPASEMKRIGKRFFSEIRFR